jgi:hypothetical protein
LFVSRGAVAIVGHVPVLMAGEPVDVDPTVNPLGRMNSITSSPVGAA